MSALRLSDRDREAAVELLGEEYAVGRISKDELDERSDAVWSARTEGDLAPVFVDLPVRPPAGGLPAIPGGAGGRFSRRWSVPWQALLLVLVALTVLTHLPLVLFGLLLWFVVGRGRHPRRRHDQHPFR